MLELLRALVPWLILASANLLGHGAVYAQEPPGLGASKAPKFALLVGVDDYAQPTKGAGISPLKGPGHDVRLMRELLTGTYGFPADGNAIVALVGKQATREAIEVAFRTHLVENARKSPDGMFFFYFSGHGSQTGDLDGDEGDGDDETLVAYDSRADGGRDITDDEVGVWLERLTSLTRNVTVILDSCHSGSATKGGGIAKRLPPARPPEGAAGRPEGARPASKDPGRLVGRDKSLSVVTGSLPEELSYEDEVETPSGKRFHGLLTYNLVRTLQRSPALTYEQAVRALEPGLRRQAPSQHPQAEGDVDRLVFAGPDRALQPYIAVSSVAGDTFTITAGSIQGLREGAIVAVYAADAERLAGEAKKLANAAVLSVRAASAKARILDAPKGPVTTSSKVAIVTAFPASRRLTVALPDAGGRDVPPDARAVAERLARMLSESKLVAVAKPGAPAFALVRAECEGPQPGRNATTSCRPAYSLSLRGSATRLFDLVVRAGTPGEIAERLSDALENLARQESVRVIDNEASPHRGAVRLSLVRVTVETEGGELVQKEEIEVPRQGLLPVRVGEHYRFKVENNSSEDFYVAIAWLGTSGRIQIYTPTGKGELVKAGGRMLTKPILSAGPPSGLETYKAIATTERDLNFRTLEQPGVGRASDASPLEWLLNQSVNARTRDPLTAKNMNLNSWTTDRLDLLVQP